AAACGDRDARGAPPLALGLRAAPDRRWRARDTSAGRGGSEMAQGNLMMPVAALTVTLLSGSAVVGAQEAPTEEMLTVQGPVEPGPRITPYLRHQLDLAWRQDDARRAEFEKARTEADVLALRTRIRARVLEIIGGLPETKTPLNARVTGIIPMQG